MKAKVTILACSFLVLFLTWPGLWALADTPTPLLTPAATPPPTPTSTPEPTPMPIPVLIVTPQTTPTPPSPWPQEVNKTVATIKTLWQTFHWWLIPILLLAGGFALARQVGKELLDAWAKVAALWLDDRRRNLAARLRRGPGKDERTLLEDLFHRYEYLEMKEFVREKVMTASLESIYVPLFAGGAGGGGRFPRGGELGGLLARGEAGEPTPVSAYLARHRCLVIAGEAGSGKTTFLRHVALTLARAWRDRRPALVRQRLDWQPDPLPLPILLPLGGFGLYLKELSDAQKDSPNPELLLGYARHHFRDLHLPAEFFEDQLKRQDRCLLLLDGLDEVAHLADRLLISQTVALLARSYEGARFVVTCRPEGYRNGAQLGGEFERIDIEPLRWPEDITTFVSRWNEVVLEASPYAARDNTQDFLQRLEHQERVRDLADNPLLLTVMIIVHFNVGRLPERRADLYNSATRLLLAWDRQWRRAGVAPPPWLDAIEPEAKRLYLEELAYHWQQLGTVEMPRDQAEQLLTPSFVTGSGEEKEREAAQRACVFLDWVVERTYLLRPLGHTLSFYRRAFQEYLAARRLAREADPAATALAALEGNWDWWEETVLLAVDHFSPWNPAQATNLLQALLDAHDDPYTAPHRCLVLAGRALADAAREHLPWQLVQETVKRLTDAVTHATPALPVPRRVQAGCALAALGDPRPGVGCAPLPPGGEGLGVRGKMPDILWVEIPAGPFRMGSTPQQVQSWKDWTWQAIQEGRYTSPEGWTKERLFEVYTAWLEAEEGAHDIDVPAFYIARYPVTNAQFAPFVDEKTGGYGEPGLWTGAGWAWRQGEGEGWGRPPERRAEPMYWRDSRFNRPTQPVVGITWFEAWAYCRWLSRQWRTSNGEWRIWRDGQLETLDLPLATFEIRLPTEAEWEKAARGPLPSPSGREPALSGAKGAGGEGRTWPWGDDWHQAKANTAEGRGDWTTTPVGLYPEGASPYDVLDLAGNVWEWTASRWGDDWRTPDYSPPYRSDDGREEPQGMSLRVVRGGSWDVSRDRARCAGRDGYGPDYWDGSLGLRVAVSPKCSGF